MGAIPIADCGLRNADWQGHFEQLAGQRRAGRLLTERPLWIAAERVSMLEAVFPAAGCEPALVPPGRARVKSTTRGGAVWERVSGRRAAVWPTRASLLAGETAV